MLKFRNFISLFVNHGSCVSRNIQSQTLFRSKRIHRKLACWGYGFSTTSVSPDPAAKTVQFGGVDLAEISDGDPEIEKLLKVLILEVDIFRQDGALVPDEIKKDEWSELLQLKSRSSRLRYLTFLFKNERKSENKRRRIEERKQNREILLEEAKSTGHITYGFSGSTIFLRVYGSTMDHFLNKNLFNASMFSQHIVFDCSYNDHMTKIEAKNCAKQFTMLFSENRLHRQPFHIQLCNIDLDSPMMESLCRYMPNLHSPEFPMFLTEKSYLDLYPKEKLVYLTPHCKNDLVEWNHDDIYIIGAIVDKTDPKPLSLAKAKQEGLRMAKLPLERNLVWGSGAGKSLTLNQMVSILLDVRHTGKWEEGFKHIPRRKVISGEDLAKEDDMRFRKGRPYDRIPVRPGEVRVSSNMIKNIRPKKVDYESLFND